jgi:hypothetical protein
LHSPLSFTLITSHSHVYREVDQAWQAPDRSNMWPEIQACVDNNKHELRVTGKTLEKRLEESSGKVPEQLPSFLTFAELSGCAQLTELPQSLGQVTQLHGERGARCRSSSSRQSSGCGPLQCSSSRIMFACTTF